MSRIPGVQFNLRWLAAALLVTILSSVLMLTAQPVAAESAPQPAANILPQSQIFNDDLTVKGGQVLSGDVVVYSGDAKVEDGGKILGNLTVYSGDVMVEKGGLIEGSITSWSGDVEIDGRVGGSVTVMSGDVELGDSASVSGDISVVTGNIQQRAGASVSGNLLRGPQFQFSAPAVPGMPPLAPPAPGPMSLAERLFDFLGRALLAIIVFGLFVGGAIATAGLRPQWVTDVHATMRRQLALSFAVGLMVNVLALAFIGLLYLTVCLRPPALLLGLILAAVNIAGLAVVGYEFGGRIGARFGENWTTWARVGVGAAAPVAVIVLLWLFGWCFTFFAWLGALLIGSFGLGAIVVRMLGISERSQPPAATQASAPATAPVASPPTETPAAAGVPEGDAVRAPEPVTVAPQEPSETIAAEPEAVVAVVAVESSALAGGDVADFTQITGIGPKLSQKLVDAGVRTYADLGARTAGDVAQILGWTEDRVARVQIVEQAQRLADTR